MTRSTGVAMAGSGPNLFVVGAMKSGTTTLHSLLGAHPRIFMSAFKEPTHFVDGEELRALSPDIWRAGYWDDRDRYLSLFAGAGDAAYRGESSTNYSKLPRLGGVAERIAGFDPDARIIYLVRDPVERTISHYWHMARWHDETRDMLTAIREEPHYREVSNYAMQLEPYLACFGPAHVKVVTAEALAASPRVVMRDVHDWLGIDAAVDLPDPAPRNVTPAVATVARGRGTLRRLRRWRHWGRVARVIPAPVKAGARRMAARSVDRTRVSTVEVVAYLRPRQQAETLELAERLGRDFPEWTTLYPARSA